MKQKASLFLLCFLLLSVLLQTTSCNSDRIEATTTAQDSLPATDAVDPDNPHNVSVKHVYSYVATYDALLRTDFNVYGQSLGTTKLNWHNLTPVEPLSVYRYDSDGKMIYHAVGGASLLIQYDENGLPSFGYGFDKTVHHLSYYTCTSDGRVLSEDIKVLNQQTYHHVYDDNGYLVAVTSEKDRINGTTIKEYAITYLENEVTSVRDDTSFTLKLDEKGLPTALFQDNDTWSLCRWTYDENGNCTYFDGREPHASHKQFEHLLKASMTYREDGQLLTYQVDYTDTELEDYTVAYVYDEDGTCSRSVRNGTHSDVITVFEDGSPIMEVTTTYETVNGEMIVDSVKESSFKNQIYTGTKYTTNENGDRLLAESGSYHYNAHNWLTDGTTSIYNASGVLSMTMEVKLVFNVDGSYDRFDKTVRYNTDGSLKLIEETTIKRDRDGVVTQKIQRNYPDVQFMFYGDATVVTDYENGARVKTTTTYVVEDGGFYGNWERDEKTIITEIFDPESGDVTSYHQISYIDGILKKEISHLYPPLIEEDDVRSKQNTVTYETSDDGIAVREERDAVYYRNGHDDITTSIYHDDILISITYELKSSNKFVTDDYWTMSRLEYKIVRAYLPDGSLSTITETHYEYHENGRLAKVFGTITDAEGDVMETIWEEYDENGVMI